MGNFSIHHDFHIGKPPAKVFECITAPKHLENWWPLKCSGKPMTGETYNFNFTDAYDWYGEVVKVEADTCFHIKMTKSDNDWNATSFGFDLEEHASGTKVKFWHTGWPKCNDEYRQSSYCWAILLHGLKNYVEKGIIVPFEERE